MVSALVKTVITLFEQIGPFMFVVLRLGGVFFLAPIVSGVSIPYQVRILLTFGLGLAVFASVPREVIPPLPTDIFTLAAWAVGETIIGFLIGLLAMIPLTALQLGGLLMGQQIGLGLAQIVNPSLETDSDLLGELLLYLGLGAFLALGGFELVFVAAAHSFTHLPMGGFSLAAAPYELIRGLIGSGFEMALRVSLPVMAILLFETIASAFIAKTVPQLNVTNLGFGLKIVLGLAAMTAGLVAIHDVTFDRMGESLGQLMTWAAGSTDGSAVGSANGSVVGPAGGAR